MSVCQPCHQCHLEVPQATYWWFQSSFRELSDCEAPIQGGMHASQCCMQKNLRPSQPIWFSFIDHGSVYIQILHAQQDGSITHPAFLMSSYPFSRWSKKGFVRQHELGAAITCCTADHLDCCTHPVAFHFLLWPTPYFMRFNNDPFWRNVQQTEDTLGQVNSSKKSWPWPGWHDVSLKAEAWPGWGDRLNWMALAKSPETVKVLHKCI